ncbi:MAG: hypothetical protein IJW82_04690 [Clostridia bacterium]|nr:hypothetical protein [Clostridia bacterium]
MILKIKRIVKKEVEDIGKLPTANSVQQFNNNIRKRTNEEKQVKKSR